MQTSKGLLNILRWDEH